MKRTIRFRLNGKPTTLETEPDRSLLWVLRTDLELTGTKYGCGEGICGTCTVAVDGDATRSCQTMMGDMDGKNVTTIEGLERNGKLHPLQQAFADRGALQCGYCTPGMIMSAFVLLGQKRALSREEIITEMDANLCRCGAHPRIIDAIEDASKNMRGGK